MAKININLKPDNSATSVEIELIDRQSFLLQYWNYKQGEHVTILGPTGSGKTTLAYELLKHSATEELPAVVLVMKPRDQTAAKYSKDLDFRVVRNWPPPKLKYIPKKPKGWTLWPKHTFNVTQDEHRMHTIFARAMMDCYKRGNRIVFADELLGLTDDLQLDDEVRVILTRGRSMGCGFWSASQRPFNVPMYAYDQAEHLFLAYDPDARTIKRYSEIGGVNPKLVSAITPQLDKHQWLYIQRSGKRGPALCIVQA